MRQSTKHVLWILPVVGFGLGLAWAHVFFTGLSETWHKVGNPGEAVVRIIGIRDGRQLLVGTETGRIYSLGFSDLGEVALPPAQVWEIEQQETVDEVSRTEWGKDFLTLPPLFKVEQLYKLEYVYKVEGKGEVKFALAPGGNIWMWTHQIAGLTGLVYYFYPVMGFLACLAVALSIVVIGRLKRKVLGGRHENH
ncbi:MAG: hypothetical protein EHM70_22005 [Chloroflexota bacterium]|nr:MAG: hypothetical protein EHM70_22005 [Chloroflexota bacterium]